MWGHWQRKKTSCEHWLGLRATQEQHFVLHGDVAEPGSPGVQGLHNGLHDGSISQRCSGGIATVVNEWRCNPKHVKECLSRAWCIYSIIQRCSGRLCRSSVAPLTSFSRLSVVLEPCGFLKSTSRLLLLLTSVVVSVTTFYFYRVGLLAIHPTPNLEDQVLSFIWPLTCSLMSQKWRRGLREGASVLAGRFWALGLECASITGEPSEKAKEFHYFPSRRQGARWHGLSDLIDDLNSMYVGWTFQSVHQRQMHPGDPPPSVYRKFHLGLAYPSGMCVRSPCRDRTGQTMHTGAGLLLSHIQYM